MSLKINRISSNSLGTYYGIFQIGKLIHYEFSRAAAEKVLEKLQGGKTIEEALKAEPAPKSELVNVRLVKPQVSLTKKHQAPFLKAVTAEREFKFDPVVYRQIELFKVNEIVQVANRKGRRSTIHITDIVKLSWHQLQMLVSGGKTKFEKQCLLYNEYSTKHRANSVLKGTSLSQVESLEIQKYISIFKENGFSKHTQVNDYITNNNLWGNFSTIRSLNDHGEYKEIEGIEPQYFEVVCRILNISGEGGRSLDNFKKY
ncbi:hypothetical protein AT00_09155 [Pseudoalteromonas lipolytica SCSIO 04301]|uniref:hypothetical protein n=1 Tax=Pseudoalteromonas lipolytica TaxID=570156 RepID=UPI0004492A34|nr:hypothetical protein [Pseudoalteromonas lipolytica]EWH06174.1 hypothetical protein AT00_09155 [Pseudoalteromonas lipolytica SCSIO 04301]|tara:strand:+ start:4810 stop:5583 length:774 start_codon:yes stop_codon:yes gene_type:complete